MSNNFSSGKHGMVDPRAGSSGAGSPAGSVPSGGTLGQMPVYSGGVVDPAQWQGQSRTVPAIPRSDYMPSQEDASASGAVPTAVPEGMPAAPVNAFHHSSVPSAAVMPQQGVYSGYGWGGESTYAWSGMPNGAPVYTALGYGVPSYGAVPVPPKKKRVWLRVLLIVLLVLAVAGAGVSGYVFFTGRWSASSGVVKVQGLDREPVMKEITAGAGSSDFAFLASGSKLEGKALIAYWKKDTHSDVQELWVVDALTDRELWRIRPSDIGCVEMEPAEPYSPAYQLRDYLFVACDDSKGMFLDVLSGDVAVTDDGYPVAFTMTNQVGMCEDDAFRVYDIANINDDPEWEVKATCDNLILGNSFYSDGFWFLDYGRDGVLDAHGQHVAGVENVLKEESDSLIYSSVEGLFVVFGGPSNESIFAIDRNGRERWRFPAGRVSYGTDPLLVVPHGDDADVEIRDFHTGELMEFGGEEFRDFLESNMGELALYNWENGIIGGHDTTLEAYSKKGLEWTYELEDPHYTVAINSGYLYVLDSGDPVGILQ